jgi:DNA adenine methylase
MSDLLQKVTAKPFVKWAGGKRQLLDEIKKRFPKSINKYYEPFVGGGAVFFNINHHKAVICDINEELINAYRVIKSNIEELISSLKRHSHNKEYFYSIRNKNPVTLDPVERASRFIFLNKTCYNGLFRVNKKGRFNVPFGRYKNPLICDEDNLRVVSLFLQNVEIHCDDFACIFHHVKRGDFVYFDPPYVPLSATSGFVGYAKNGFTKKDQIRLKALFKELTEKEVFCMLSNSFSHFVLDLYREFRINIVYSNRTINSKGLKRGKIRELIITNYQ